MRFTLAILLIIVLVGIAGFISLNEATGAVTAPRTIKGTISDVNGLPLYKNYRQSLSMIVAVNQNDQIVGWGPLETSRSYKLSFRSGFKLPVYLKLGYYDAYRQERGELWDCTELTDISRLTDIVCDQFNSIVPQKSIMYR